MRRLAKLIPGPWRRRLEVFLIDRGFPTKKPRGDAGIGRLGHRGYVTTRPDWFDSIGVRQFELLCEHGLRPGDVLCDIGCGSLRGGRHLIPYLEPGHYLGLEGESKLVELGVAHELDAEVMRAKSPRFVYSYDFAFNEFSLSPTYALAVSVFTHLTESDIRRCLNNLAAHVTGTCRLFASYFESARPTPNFKRSHPHLAFYYTRAQLEQLGRDAGWTPQYLGDWGSPTGQPMMKFTIGGEITEGAEGNPKSETRMTNQIRSSNHE